MFGEQSLDERDGGSFAYTQVNYILSTGIYYITLYIYYAYKRPESSILDTII